MIHSISNVYLVHLGGGVRSINMASLNRRSIRDKYNWLHPCKMSDVITHPGPKVNLRLVKQLLLGMDV